MTKLSTQTTELKDTSLVDGYDSENSLKLNNQLCFPIYALSKKIINSYRPLLKQLDLTYPQYLVMLVLWEHQQQTVGDLCKKLHSDTGTITPLLKRLEAKELVCRTRNNEDERVVSISISESGQLLKQKAEHVPLAVFTSFSKEIDMTEEEFNVLNMLSKKFCTVNT